jgi:hypothetical protein
MCTCITFCWIRALFNTTLIGPVVFGGHGIYVLAFYSAGPDRYLTILQLVI